MIDDHLLREALGSLLTDQPPAPDRVAAVRGRLRRRLRVWAGVSVVAAAVAVTGVAVLVPRSTHRAVAPTTRPAPSSSPFLDWRPRLDGEVGLTAVQSVQNVWLGEGGGSPVVDQHPLYSGVPAGTTQRWVVLEGTAPHPAAPSLAGPRLVVATTAGAPGFEATVVADVPAPAPGRTFQISVVLPRVAHGVYAGQPGSTDRTIVFALPEPGRSVQVRAREGYAPKAARRFDQPQVLNWSGVAAPVEVSADGVAWRRAGLPLTSVAGVQLAPPTAPAGWVVTNVLSGDAGGSFSYQVPTTEHTRLLARCTTYSDQRTQVAVATAAEQSSDEVLCDGAVHQVGVDLVVPPGGFAVTPSGDADALVISVLVPTAEARRLPVPPILQGFLPTG